MYPSNNSHYGNDPISFCEQPFCCRSFSLDNNPTSKQDSNNRALPPPPPPPASPPFSFFHFPSPFEDNEIFLEQHHDFLLHHQSLAASVHNMEVSINNKVPSGKGGGRRVTTEQIQRKRSCKRDRHSKINTARGLRDRRMRLSLEVARRFFGLQDMLGFEKASKTVEWLLNQAKVEIKQLAREKKHPSCSSAGAKSASSTSECEGVSSLDEVAVSGTGNQEQQEMELQAVKRRKKASRKSAFHPLARESREKARERARERTKEKMRSRRLAADQSKQCREATNHELSQLGSWNPFEMGEESGTHSQSVNPSMDVLNEAEEPSSHAKELLGTVEDMAHDDSLAIISKWSPSMIFNSLNNYGILQEHQFGEFQSLGKLWEAYNNHM